MNPNCRCQTVFSIALAAFLLLASTAGAQSLKRTFPKAFTVTVANPLGQERHDVAVLMPAASIKREAPGFNPKAFVVLDGQQEIPSQYNQQDAANAGIVLVLDQLGPKASRQLTVRYQERGSQPRHYTKRTQAELSHKVGGHFENRKYIGGTFTNVDSLRVPDEHTDHSFDIRYEGPGWESDKVGYRFYLDWRNGYDVFGKKTPDMVLQQVGQDGFDSYHEESVWGMDVLKVGKSLGVGTLAMYTGGAAQRVAETDSIICVIAENGPVFSSIHTTYYGWQVAGQKLDVNSTISIPAGSRLTHHQVKVTGGEPQNLSTGLIKDKKARLFSSQGTESQWGYLATYGKQSLNGEGDNLGLAVLFRPTDFIAFPEDALSHVVELQPRNGQLDYYFLAAWELEPNGIKTEEQFLDYLNQKAAELAAPVQVRIGKSR